MGKWVKGGPSPNPAGRGKNASGVKTLERHNRARNMLAAIEKHESIEKLIAQLTPRERALLYKDLVEYEQPKMSRQEITSVEKKVEIKQVFVIGGKEIEL